MTAFEAFNQPGRSLGIIAKIYFDASPLIVTDLDDIVRASFTENIGAAGALIVGGPTSNSATLQLMNLNQKYNPMNSDSPYFGKMKQGLKVELFMKEVFANQEVLVGTYTVSDWESDSKSMFSTVYLWDKLGPLLNQKAPNIDMGINETVSSFLSRFFAAIGFTPAMYQLDAALNSLVIPRSFTLSTIRDTLAKLGEAFRLFIYSDRQGLIHVKCFSTTATPVGTFTDIDQICSTGLKSTLTDKYGKLSVKYNSTIVDESCEVLSIKDVGLLSGTSVMSSQVFSKNPVGQVTYIDVQSDIGAECTHFTYTSDTIDIHYTATKSGKASFIVYGETILEAKAVITGTINSDVPDEVSVDNEYIQNETIAKALIDHGKVVLKDEALRIQTATRGNPGLKAGEVINYRDTTNKVVGRLLVLEHSVDCASGMSGTLSGILIGGVS